MLPRPVEARGTGTLKGKITLEGARPEVEKLNKALREAMQKKDGEHCLSDKAPDEQKEQQLWRIDKNGGVGNVFVWLRPPDGTYFKIDPAEQTWPREVALDQPYCAFVPHALVLFPEYVDPADPRKRIRTGQQFVVKNSSSIYHNVNWNGGPDNPGENRLLLPGRKLLPDLMPSDREVIFQCNLHPWMRASIRVFNHPYATVSRSDGTYEIDNVPAGSEISLVVWHEVAGYTEGIKGRKVTLKEGVNEINFSLRAD